MKQGEMHRNHRAVVRSATLHTPYEMFTNHHFFKHPMVEPNKKIALVTGANKGIGQEITRQLAQQGFTVLLGARDPEKGDRAAKDLQQSGLAVYALHLDITDEALIQQTVEIVTAKFGKLDVLVNNAGINPEDTRDRFIHGSELERDLLRQIYETNVFGAFAMIKNFLPLLKQSPAGRIVNLSSTLGSLADQSNPNSPFYPYVSLGYNSSKAALNMMTIAFAKELADTPIKINAACPGWVRTDMGREEAPRSVTEGAQVPVQLATLPDDGPTGGFFDANGRVAW
jgi:NAD(P)-dependent dehydrogenase (short-subunit alcohol dehydrogenase family)